MREQLPGDAIAGEVEITEADVHSAVAQMMGLTSWKRNTLAGMALLMAGLGIWQLVRGAEASTAWPTIGGGALCAFIRWCAPYLNARAIFRSMHSDHRRMRVVFHGDSWEMYSASGVSVSKLSALHRWQETPGAFLLYLNRAVAIIVPKRTFREHDLLRIRALLEEWCPASRHPRPLLTGRRLAVIWVVLVVVFLGVWTVIAPRGHGRPMEPDSRDSAYPE